MPEQPLGRIAGEAADRRFLPVLLALFFGSGCAALIYEIVWFQLLQLVIGSTAVSLGVLLGTYMGGMCLGSLLLPRLISARRHPLRVYAVIELGIGALGLAVLTGMPLVSRFYLAGAGYGQAEIFLRGALCAACLLLPTMLMGATLPAIARWVEATPRGVSWLGFFYGGNIAGAVFGCLLAGFYLLRVHDMAMATYVAVAFNAGVGLLGLGLAALTTHHLPESASAADRPRPAPGSRAVYVAIGISGLCALGSEVVWTRLLSLLLGGTVYTFSIILAVFLVGLGLGSSAGSFLARTIERPRLAFAVCQLLLAAAIAWTAAMLAKSLPYWPIDATLSDNPWIHFQLDLARCAWAILPATCLWGASFPLALAGVAARGQDPGRLVGGVYAANTLGAIVGAAGCSIFLIAWIGTHQTQRVLIGLSVTAAMLLLTSRERPAREDRAPDRLRETRLVLGSAALVILAGLLIWSVPRIPGELVAYGRTLPTIVFTDTLLFVGEGMNSSVAVTDLDNGFRSFHVSGKVEASTNPEDMRLQRMLGHLPALLHPDPQSVLIVGCGAGVTAGTFVLYPRIERIVICEIEPLIPKVVARYFARENYSVLDNPKVRVIYDDARHYILTTNDKFDIITSDPIHPWIKGSATLYTREYFEMCKRHLNPGGMITQWVPLYESNHEAVKSEIATFLDVFPNGTVWGNDVGGAGYDVVLLGHVEPLGIDIDRMQTRLNNEVESSVVDSLDEVGFPSALSLLATFAGRGADLAPWLADAEINRDRNLRLQYLAGMGLNLYHGEQIYNDILHYRRFPPDMFTGSDATSLAQLLALDPRQ